MKARRSKAKALAKSSSAQSVAPSVANPEQVALQATEQATESLPHLDQIQEAFGEHDVAGVRFTGGEEAADAADDIGAVGFASGEAVVSPGGGLHDVAHEAAHVVMQRGQGGGEGISESATRESDADAAAASVVSGGSAEGLLNTYASPEVGPATPGRIERIKRHDDVAGTSTNVPIAGLAESQVLAMIADMQLNGETRPQDSDIEYEVGDLVALIAIRDTAGFGGVSTASLQAFLLTPPAELVAAGLDRHIAPAVLASFSAVFARLSSHAQVSGFGEWAASKISSVKDLGSATSADRAKAALHMLDYFNELREVEIQLGVIAATDSINIAECCIAGTAQTADLTQSNGRQVEVKTVRDPVLDAKPIRGQVGDGLAKFSGVGLGGPYEVVVFASWEPVNDVKVSNGKGREGTTTTSTDRTPALGGFTTDFAPTPPNRRPASTVTKTLAAEMLAYLNGGPPGADKANKVTIRMENPTGAGGLDNYEFTNAGGVWS